MSEAAEKAIAKIQNGVRTGTFSRYGRIMKDAVAEALTEFCRQNEEFAEAVEQGGSFQECMDKVSANIHDSISDIEAYRRAVRFYFAGAEVVFQMQIQLQGDPVKLEDVAKPTAIVLNLEDFL